MTNSGRSAAGLDEQLRRLMVVRALLWLLVLCSCSLSDARKHRYGSAHKKVAKTRYIQPVMPPDSVVIDGFVYERQRKQAGSDNPNRVEMAGGDNDEGTDDQNEETDSAGAGCFDDDSIRSIQRAVKRARTRDPDEINPEPYVMLGGLFLSAQLFR